MLVGLLLWGTAQADGGLRYQVSITNLTKGQAFTPQLVVTHDASVSLFQVGAPASLPLEILAEGGDTAPMTEALLAYGDSVGSIVTIPGLLEPGQTVSTTVSVQGKHRYLSMAAMLIPTNDTFVAVRNLSLPRAGARAVNALAYDSGTEDNDQNCLNIPGPRCGGEGHSPGPNVGDEGFVYVSNGFHELPPANAGEVLGPQTYDWRNPVARIVVRRMK
ncbi:MAG: spondin domain-containing protein [Pseudomonadales bacterium]